MNDLTFLSQLNEALRGGGLGGQEPSWERYALEQYTDLASEWLQEDLRTINGERVSALNKDRDYPYWFATFRHACEGAETDDLMVEVKEPWYHYYLNAEEGLKGSSSEDREKPVVELFHVFSDYLKKIAEIQKHSPLN